MKAFKIKYIAIVSLLILFFDARSQDQVDSVLSIWNDQSLADTFRLRIFHEKIPVIIQSIDKEYEPLFESFIKTAHYNSKLLYEADGMIAYGQMLDVYDNKIIESRLLFEEALPIYRKLENTYGISRALSNIGATYREDKPVKAVKLMKEAVEVSLGGGDMRSAIGCSYNLSEIYLRLGEHVKALNAITVAVNKAEELQDRQFIAMAYHGLSHVYLAQGEFKKGNEFHNQVLKMFRELGNVAGEQSMLIHIAQSFQNQKEFTQALLYFEKAYALSKEFGSSQQIKTALYNLVDHYTKMGDLEMANLFINKIDSISQISINDLSFQDIHILCIRGELKLKEGSFLDAIKICKQAKSASVDLNAVMQERRACQCLFDSYKKIKMGNQALLIQERIHEIDAITQAEEVALQMQQIEFSKALFADSLKQEEERLVVEMAHQEEVHKKNKTRNALIGGGLFLFLIAGGIYSRLRYVRKSKAILQVEKDRSENLLLNILPEEIAQELKEKGKADARDFEMVSILFTDFKQFTETSEKLSAQELVAEINICFEAFDKICEKYKIEKIKTIGDAYMAAGGLPVPSDDSVINTVLAAIEMQAFMGTAGGGRPSEDGKTYTADRQPPTANRLFEMRVGIHTGPVVAGIVGVKKFQYDIWGDTVNTASRAENESEVGKVNITAATYELIKEDSQFVFESRGKIDAKGKGEIEMWFVSKRV